MHSSRASAEQRLDSRGCQITAFAQPSQTSELSANDSLYGVGGVVTGACVHERAAVGGEAAEERLQTGDHVATDQHILGEAAANHPTCVSMCM